MNKRLLSLVFVLALVGSRPVLLADNLYDLDTLTLAALEHELTDELDDLFYEMGIERNGLYDGDELMDAILYALSDEDDDDNEDDVDYNEIEAEMAEAGTTVEDVVAEAIDEAGGQSSYRQESPSSPIVLARFTGDTPSFRFENAGLVLLLQDRNKVHADKAVRTTVKGLSRTTGAVRRSPRPNGP